MTDRTTSIAEMRRKALEAVDATNFTSSLPAGECDPTTLRSFLDCRREEIVAAARRALDDHALILHSEVILRLLFGEVSEKEFAVLPAA